jgi:hypothetical protein
VKILLVLIWVAGWLVQFRLWDKWWDNNRSKGCGCHQPLDDESILAGVWLSVLAISWLLWPIMWIVIRWIYDA